MTEVYRLQDATNHNVQVEICAESPLEAIVSIQTNFPNRFWEIIFSYPKGDE